MLLPLARLVSAPKGPLLPGSLLLRLACHRYLHTGHYLQHQAVHIGVRLHPLTKPRTSPSGRR